MDIRNDFAQCVVPPYGHLPQNCECARIEGFHRLDSFAAFAPLPIAVVVLAEPAASVPLAGGPALVVAVPPAAAV